MTLTQAQMDWLDEQPTRRRGGRILSFTDPRDTRRRAVTADDLYAEARRAVRRRQLAHYARMIEAEELA